MHRFIRPSCLLISVILGLSACNSSTPVSHNSKVTVIESEPLASEGLDLQAIGSYLEKVETAEELERAINNPKLGLNNLDLDGNDSTDVITVDEEHDGKIRIFSLSTEVQQGEVQHLADINVEKSGEKAQVEIHGNSQVYGSGHYYHHSYPMHPGSFWYWAFMPRPLWASPWYWGYRSPFYGYHPVMGMGAYRSHIGGMRGGAAGNYQRSGKTTMSKQTNSKMSSKSAKTGVRSKLSKPTASQRSFRKQDPKAQARSGRFGRTSAAQSRQSGKGRVQKSTRTSMQNKRTSTRSASVGRGRSFGGGRGGK